MRFTCQIPYSYSTKRYVFKDLRKLLVHVSSLSLSGSLFHKIGAAVANARSPYVRVDEVGTINKFLFEDRRFLGGMYGVIISVR